MKVLVTGGAGFIASHVADALVGNRHDVHILDDLSSGKLENVPAGATFHQMDIRDPGVGDLFAEHRFEVLVHHAAQMDVRRSVADPAFDAGVNLIGFLNLMESARKAGLKKVVFASTGGAIYGEPEYVPQDEKHPLKPLSPYGITKLSTEKYLYFYQQEYGIPFVALRYGNVYGPRQNPHGEAGVIAIFINRLLANSQAVIYGDGEQTRDYVYVGDVVQANMAAVKYDGSGIFNVGTSIETNVNQLFRLLRDEIRPEMPERHEEARPGEQRRSVLDYKHSEQVLGWAPTVSVEDGLKATVKWFRARAVDA
ncbi:MAG: NAD-dependent epimerase/dehydratase family protein [Rhodothermales bacterium]|nr:NAD-dependent epimerase/dehydratase family protein [Rhodothermales bacterium]